MIAKTVLCLLVAVTFLTGVPMTARANVREQIIIKDLTGGMPRDQFARLTDKTRLTMGNVRAYWEVADHSDVILVEFVRQVHRVPSTFFFFRPENGRRVKVVRVYGGGEEPHQLAHKLTSALFPHPDKLVRNMMGEAAEMRFGNPVSFPMCGYAVDDWVAAFIRTDSYIPLAGIGTSHESWGMEIVNNVPVVKDRKKQHASYAEAGSFGQFLLETFGPGKMKEFYRRTQLPNRPWREVFGSPLEELEQRWLDKVKQKAAENPEVTAAAVSFWQKDPRSACYQAQGQR